MIDSADRPGVAVVLSIHRPDRQLLSRLLASIRTQEAVRPVIYAVLDGAATATDEALLAGLAGDDVCTIPLPRQLGVRNAFAAGLRAALAAAPSRGHRYFAFADQDDVWHPEKLRLSAAAMATHRASLVHCDARVIAPDGSVVSPSLHRFEARESATDLFDHIVLNQVTGMTALFDAATARRTVGLLDEPGAHLLHDHMAAIAASAGGTIVWIDQPLVDYIQHDSNLMGAVKRRGGWPNLLVWLRDISSYRAASLASFVDRRQAVIGLHREGLAPGDIREAFMAGGPTGRWRLARFYLAAAARYLKAGQTRRWLVSLRLLDGALQFRRVPDRSAGM